MSKESFWELIRLIRPTIRKKDTNCRKAISPEERLLITLTYLATGSSFISLSFHFMKGGRTIGIIVAETTNSIWECLNKDYMPVPNNFTWRQIAERFYQVWNLPNCVGAVDGKHIRIQKLPRTGSTNYNYKSYHSIILMACCDADGIFTIIEVDHAGRNSDGGVFKASQMGRLLAKEGLDLPPKRKLPQDQTGEEIPYFFKEDEAFPLNTYLMRPYPARTLNNVRRIFNNSFSE